MTWRWLPLAILPLAPDLCQGVTCILGDGVSNKTCKHTDDGAYTLGIDPSCRQVSIEGAGLGDAGATALAKAIAEDAAPALTSLRLRGNGIGVAGVSRLATALFTRQYELDPDLETPDDAEGVPGAQLQDLDLSENFFGDAGVEALSDVLRGASGLPAGASLLSLSLADCGVGDQGAEALSGALRSSFNGQKSSLPRLQALRLHNNRIGDAGAAALAAVLAAAADVSLEDLSLRENVLIGSAGAKALATALTTMRRNTPFKLGFDASPKRVGAEASAAVAAARLSQMQTAESVRASSSPRSDGAHKVEL